jgi:ribosomal protein L16/L10AE
LNRTGIVFITTFPQIPISRKPNEVRMGRGKGSLDHWSAAVFPGSVIFEIGGVDRDLAHKALKLASAKLPVKTSIIDTKPIARDYKQVNSEISSERDSKFNHMETVLCCFLIVAQ